MGVKAFMKSYLDRSFDFTRFLRMIVHCISWAMALNVKLRNFCCQNTRFVVPYCSLLFHFCVFFCLFFKLKFSTPLLMRWMMEMDLKKQRGLKKKSRGIVGALRCKYNFVKMLAPKWYLVQLQNAKQTTLPSSKSCNKSFNLKLQPIKQ